MSEFVDLRTCGNPNRDQLRCEESLHVILMKLSMGVVARPQEWKNGMYAGVLSSGEQ